MATIRDRNNKYQAIVRRKGHPELTKTFTFMKDAMQWARRQEALIDSGLWVDRTSANQTTLYELLTRYAKEVTTLKKGRRAEEYRLSKFKTYSISKLAVAAVTPQILAKWRDERLLQVSTGTALRELELISHVFTVAMKDWGIALHSNPVKQIRKPPQGKPRERVLSDEERRKLIDACYQCRNSWIRPIVIFALETGARRGEILELQWKEVNLLSNTARFSTTKTGFSRTIPLSPVCVAMLKDLPRNIYGRVFPITMEALKQAYERAVTRAEISGFTFHDLRHDALTRLAQQGFNILELRAISGHKTMQMLQRYTHLRAEDLAKKFN